MTAQAVAYVAPGARLWAGQRLPARGHGRREERLQEEMRARPLVDGERTRPPGAIDRRDAAAHLDKRAIRRVGDGDRGLHRPRRVDPKRANRRPQEIDARRGHGAVRDDEPAWQIEGGAVADDLNERG